MRVDREEFLRMLCEDIVQKNKILLIGGNGGSAAIADHMVGEMLGRFARDRRPYPAINLSSSIATLTCISNDYGYKNIFSRQIEAFGGCNPIVLLMSTSGESENINNALKRSKELGIKTYLMTGVVNSSCSLNADFEYISATNNTGACQEEHLATLHEACKIIDRGAK